MKRIFPNTIIISLITFSLMQGVLANAATTEIPCKDMDVTCWINKSKSKDLNERVMAMGRLEFLYYRYHEEAAKEALIDLLRRESAKIQPDGTYKSENPTIEGDEGEEGYFRQLCIVVSKFADPEIYPLFVKIGNLTALSNYGDMAIDTILAKLEDKHPGLRSAATTILGNMLTPKEKGYTAQGESRQKIRVALLKATKDEDITVKVWAVKALSNFQDDEVIVKLEDIKKHDPSFTIGKNPQTGEKGYVRYLAREEAEKALEKIKKVKGE